MATTAPSPPPPAPADLPTTDHDDVLDCERAYLDARGGPQAAEKAFQ